MLRYEVSGDVVTIHHYNGKTVLTDAAVVGTMATGRLNGILVEINLMPERDGFYYGYFEDGSRLQLKA